MVTMVDKMSDNDTELYNKYAAMRHNAKVALLRIREKYSKKHHVSTYNICITLDGAVHIIN